MIETIDVEHWRDKLNRERAERVNGPWRTNLQKRADAINKMLGTSLIVEVTATDKFLLRDAYTLAVLSGNGKTGRSHGEMIKLLDLTLNIALSADRAKAMKR